MAALEVIAAHMAGASRMPAEQQDLVISASLWDKK